MDRLQKVISQCGVTSRRKAEKLITDGRVKVNGAVVTELGTKVNSSDIIEVDDVVISKEDREYYLLNKPRGYICSVSDDKNRKTVVELIDTDKRIFPVGRLDYDTTGALLLTNDGDFLNIMTHPKNNIDKVYLAKLNKVIDVGAINKLKNGVDLDGSIVKASKVKLRKVNDENNTCIVEIVIHEGLNHQIKRMFEKVGYDVKKLTRKRIGIFDCKGLKSGEYRRLTPKEVQIIYSYKEKRTK